MFFTDLTASTTSSNAWNDWLEREAFSNIGPNRLGNNPEQPSNLRIGVVGPLDPIFDPDVALTLLRRGLDWLEPTEMTEVVSSLVNSGIPAIAYHEARRRGWKTNGIACSKALDYDCYTVNSSIIVGQDWGDEYQEFLDAIDVLIQLGQEERLAKLSLHAKNRCKHLIELELPLLISA